MPNTADQKSELLSGAVSRREMLERLGYLGLSAAALALLPGCPGGSTWMPREERDRLAKEAAQANAAAGGAAPVIPSELRLSKADYSAPGVHDWSAGSLKGFIFLDANGQWLALSRTCTHARCAVTWKEADAIFLCKCHGSRFDPAGAVLKGPAKRPLPSYPVREDGAELVIDLSGATASDVEKVRGAGKGGDQKKDDDDGDEGGEHRGRDDDDGDEGGEDSGKGGEGKDAAPGWNP